MEIIFVLIALLSGNIDRFSANTDTVFKCKPCNLPCDKLSFKQKGVCPHCNMELISEEELLHQNRLIVNKVAIGNGSGVFLLEGGKGREEKHLMVYYYKPKGFTPTSRVLMVIPGAGRNADDYRNAWIEASEKYNVLVLSPHYSKDMYDFDAYQMGGLLYDSNLEECTRFVPNSNVVELDEQKFKFKVHTNPDQWIFNDFDRIFNVVVKATGSVQDNYDIFGHSAGGQILHRLVLFNPDSKANRILASNAGAYTVPVQDTELPFGLKNSFTIDSTIQLSFKKKLVLFLGEQDNENETGGTLLRSPTVDKQGLGRYARGMYFYSRSQERAKTLSTDFNWELVTIPNTGHDYKKISSAAAVYLYGELSK